MRRPFRTRLLLGFTLAAQASAADSHDHTGSCQRFSCARVAQWSISCDDLWSDVCPHGTGRLKVRAVCPNECAPLHAEVEWQWCRRLLFADVPINTSVASRAPDNWSVQDKNVPNLIAEGTPEQPLRALGSDPSFAATSRRLLSACKDAPDASIIKASAGFYTSW